MQRCLLTAAISLFSFMSRARLVALSILLPLQWSLASSAFAQTPDSLNLPHNLSPWGMFMQADWVVKAVMLGLLLASVVTWTVWLVKSTELRRARRQSAEPLRQLTSAESLPQVWELAGQQGPVGALLTAARVELDQSDGLSAAGIQERLEGRFARILAALSRHAKSGTGVLATVGSVAPFVGLFGTVWGIMNSFIGIAEAQTSNLAVVAPGIAEALLATALGLVAAIPAVVMYNLFARKIADYRALTADMAGEVMRLVSLHIDRASTPAGK